MATEPFIVGDTVKFRVTFITWAGSRSDADAIYFEVYSNNRLIKTIEEADITHVSTGVYEVLYIIPSNQNLKFRFVGEIEGYPEVVVDTDHTTIS
jgi:hypothetical protein